MRILWVIRAVLTGPIRTVKHLWRNSAYRHTATIGRNTTIKACCKIEPPVKIGANTSIGENVALSTGVIIGGRCSLKNIEVGMNSHIDGGVIALGAGKGTIRIGKEVYIGINNILDYSDNITIGDFVHIAGPSTGLWTHSSAEQARRSIPIKMKDIETRPTSPIVIGNNVYIGGNCTIYPGVTIGDRAVVAPNSAVTKDVPSSTMFGGVPATLIKNIEIG